MNASAKMKASETSIAEPTLMDALAAMKVAMAQDREMTAEESSIVARVLSKADRAAAAAVHQLGQELDRASQARAARAAYDAADRARARSADFAATRARAFAELPPWLQLQWSLLERAGGRSTGEGRALARLLEDIARGEAPPLPTSFLPAPKAPGQP
jgi:hypothetical protein